jgi:hypothetical protein
MQRLNLYTDNFPEFSPVTPSEYESLFDDSGRLLDPASFRSRLYDPGTSDCLLPFVTGLHSIDSTIASRVDTDAELHRHFWSLHQQADNLLPSQRSPKISIIEGIQIE